jgi:hypothetical protein
MVVHQGFVHFKIYDKAKKKVLHYFISLLSLLRFTGRFIVNFFTAAMRAFSIQFLIQFRR